MKRNGKYLCLLLFVFAVGGCGGPSYEMTTVDGICKCDGEPMSTGIIVLTPVPEPGSKNTEPGKPAAAEIQPDGRFTLSTYGDKDGAVVGKHQVHLRPGDDDDEEGGKKKPVCTKAPEDLIVEVKPGKNNLNIELSSKD